jgi:hypothetical protein
LKISVSVPLIIAKDVAAFLVENVTNTESDATAFVTAGPSHFSFVFVLLQNPNFARHFTGFDFKYT